MAISKLLNTEDVKNKNLELRKCLKFNCSYHDGVDSCCAEWCIYSQLPKMITEEKEAKCLVCGKTENTISVYSNQVYICSSCKTRLKKLMGVAEDE